ADGAPRVGGRLRPWRPAGRPPGAATAGARLGRALERGDLFDGLVATARRLPCAARHARCAGSRERLRQRSRARDADRGPRASGRRLATAALSSLCYDRPMSAGASLRVLVATDFSPTAVTATEWAAQLVRARGGTVTLVHALDVHGPLTDFLPS